MNTAVLKFKSLGIDDVVKNLKLAELGNNIAAKLREMTGKKRKDVNGKPFGKASILINRNAYIPEQGKGRSRAPGNHHD